MFKPLRIKNIFIYITEKCNLRCDYCFFKDKALGRTLELSIFKEFLTWALSHSDGSPTCFEFSGGEPLLEWRRLTEMIVIARKYAPRSRIGLQTNAILLSKEKRRFLKNAGAELEIGIDGALTTTSAHRTPIHAGIFKTMLLNIKESVRDGLDLSSTMTVRPSQIKMMDRNFSFLRKNLLKNIDITPAALVPWTHSQMRSFKEEYSNILSKLHDNDLFLKDDLEYQTEQFIDLSLHPPGYACCGDVFLCLPDKYKKMYSLLDFKKAGRPALNKTNISFFLKSYAKEFRQIKNKATYRDYVIFSFKILKEIMKRHSAACDTMIELLTYQKKQHQAFALLKK